MARIIICRTDEVLRAMSARRDIDAVLSFERPDLRPRECGYAPRISDRPQYIITCVGTEDKSHLHGPDEISIRHGLIFGSRVIQAEQTLLIHCYAGRGRSPAMAIGVLSAARPDAMAVQIVNHVCSIRPIAAPNMLIADMADTLTHRHGELTQAIKDHPMIARNRTSGRQIANFVRANPNAAIARLRSLDGPA